MEPEVGYASFFYLLASRIYMTIIIGTRPAMRIVCQYLATRNVENSARFGGIEENDRTQTICKVSCPRRRTTDSDTYETESEARIKWILSGSDTERRRMRRVCDGARTKQSGEGRTKVVGP